MNAADLVVRRDDDREQRRLPIRGHVDRIARHGWADRSGAVGGTWNADDVSEDRASRRTWPAEALLVAAVLGSAGGLPDTDTRSTAPRWTSRVPPDADGLHGAHLPRGGHRPRPSEGAGAWGAVRDPVRAAAVPGGAAVLMDGASARRCPSAGAVRVLSRHGSAPVRPGSPRGRTCHRVRVTRGLRLHTVRAPLEPHVDDRVPRDRRSSRLHLVAHLLARNSAAGLRGACARRRARRHAREADDRGLLDPSALAYRPTALPQPREHPRRDRVWTAALVVVPILAAAAWTRHADAIKAASRTTEWLTSTELREWNFGTLDQRLERGTWETILDRIRGTVALFGWIFLPVAVFAGTRSRQRWFWLASPAPLCFRRSSSPTSTTSTTTTWRPSRRRSRHSSDSGRATSGRFSRGAPSSWRQPWCLRCVSSSAHSGGAASTGTGPTRR